jgi:hypothetical protein
MSGGIIFKNGGPLGWFGEHQERMLLSSCEAEIRATCATSKKVDDFRNLSCSVSASGLPIADIASPTILYNKNSACVKWTHNMTSKAARHIELCKNSVREWVRDKTVDIRHVAGRINLADIFTKEMRDGAHFWRLPDSFMSCMSDFLCGSILALHHDSHASSDVWTPAAAPTSCAAAPFTGYLAALAASSFFRSLTNISYLCSAGRYL